MGSEIYNIWCHVLSFLHLVSSLLLAHPGLGHLRTKAGLWPNGILQCAALLAAGGYDRPCGPIESLFLLSPAGMLDGRARLYSSELSYSFFILLHHLS